MNNTVLTDLNNAESYCSIKGDNREALVAMYNAINSPDHKLSDFVGKELRICDISIERVENMNEETGEMAANARVVFIDENGESYTCVSSGIYSAIKKLVAVFGEPTWDPALPVEVQNLSTKKGRKTMTLKAI
nr:MAG TPA: Single stranded DNA binding protein [Caudoviricetes sp.]